MKKKKTDLSYLNSRVISHTASLKSVFNRRKIGVKKTDLFYMVICLGFVFPCQKLLANHPGDPNEIQPLDANWDYGAFGPKTKEEKNKLSDKIQFLKDWPRKKKVVALNLAVVGGILAVGIGNWDYGSSALTFKNEGWFGRNTKYGGADKLGHAYGAYVMATLYKNIYAHWGFSDQEANLGGALSSWTQMTVMEFADGFSVEQGFSWEDEVMDTVGVAMAYLRNRYPAIKEKIDFRMEWIPSSAFRNGNQSDPFTDYSGQKYLLALKPDGFLKTNNALLKAMEFHVGYYTRGYDNEHGRNRQERSTYVGIGLNATYLIEQITGHNAWNILDYIQLPYTYLPKSSAFH